MIKTDCKTLGEATMKWCRQGKAFKPRSKRENKSWKFQNVRYFSSAGPSSLETKKLTTDFSFLPPLLQIPTLIPSSVADHLLWHPISLLPTFSGSRGSSFPNYLPLSLYARLHLQEAFIGNSETTCNQRAGRVTADLLLAFCSSRSSHPIT